MALRLVSAKTQKINLGDDGDWIEVKSDLSRRDFNRIIATLPVTRDGLDEEAIDLDTASNFSEALFETFVVGWSLVGEDGGVVPPTVENYQMLTRDSSQMIDAALSDYFNELGVSDEDAQKST